MKSDSDEYYILGLCDKTLGLNASRQHRFDFLRGDSNKPNKIGYKLPVDGYYKEKNLVVEYSERQHTEGINFFDKPEKITVSGVHRGEQRKIYDNRRRQVLPENNIKLVEISYSDFDYDKNKRIKRDPQKDEEVIKIKLEEFLK